ncbi:MAG: serine/threonine-protein kinase [Phycisphaerales bacterium]
MDAGWTRLKKIFEAALALPRDERSPFLTRACEGDETLRAHIESLLEAEHNAPSFLEQPTHGDSTVPAEPGYKAGDRIGRYKLLEPIGEGGFGTVFMAEQTEPVVRRVAVKVIKLGMDTKQVIARFEAERQALAMMDHPNIARVLDAGATESGRPYFVMELVRGIPITDYCDTNRLTPRERLDLFIPICRAVQHAHTKGIIHRDIKPTNVLVTLHDGVPIPKVIDFGIAKATNARLTEKTLFTEFRQLIGTPEYMSPEQAEISGLDVDTRTDIYSLGVLLYELLTGATPFDSARLRSAGFDEIRRIIREEEPPRPSTRLSELPHAQEPTPTSGGEGAPPGESKHSSIQSIAAHRKTDPSSLSRYIRGDLDWIVMKAIAKDRAQRYDTAHALAADIRHHLANEPVTAGPPSTIYRLRKFVRRNRVTVIAGGVVSIAVMLSAIVSIQFGLSATEQERLATERAALAGSLAQFMRETIVGELSSTDTTVRQLLDKMAERLNGLDDDDPLLLSTFNSSKEGYITDPHHWLGTAYEIYNAYDRAAYHYEKALQLKRRVWGDNDVDTLRTMHRLGVCYRRLNDWEKAAAVLSHCLEIRTEMLGPQHRDTLGTSNSLAGIYYQRGDHQSAQRLYSSIYRNRLDTLGSDHPETTFSMHQLAKCHAIDGDYQAAYALLSDAVHILGEHEDFQPAKPYYPTLLTMRRSLGRLERQMGRLYDAETRLREVIDEQQRVRGLNHLDTLETEVEIAAVLSDQGRAADAEDLFLRTLQVLNTHKNADSVSIQRTHSRASVQYGALLLAQNRAGEAQSQLEAAAAWYQEQGLERSPAGREAIEMLHNCYRDIGNESSVASESNVAEDDTASDRD